MNKMQTEKAVQRAINQMTKGLETLTKTLEKSLSEYGKPIKKLNKKVPKKLGKRVNKKSKMSPNQNVTKVVTSTRKSRFTTEQKDALVTQIRSLGRGGLSKVCQESGISMATLIKWNKESTIKVSPKEPTVVVPTEAKTRGRKKGSTNLNKVTTPTEPSVAEVGTNTIFDNAMPIGDIKVGADDEAWRLGAPKVP